MKTYLDELIEKLEAMRAEGVQPSVEEVLRTVYRVIIDAKLPGNFRRDMLAHIMSLDGFDAVEAQTLKGLDEAGTFKD